MNRCKAIWSLIFVLVFAWASRAQDKVHLIPDRTSCVSGDTVWFNAIVSNTLPDNSGNVIHVQLDNLANQHITRVSLICEKNNAEGYLHIPDSLSTGVYVLKAFTNLQKGDPKTVIHQRFITVYNRFETVVNLMHLPQKPEIDFETDQRISIQTQTSSTNHVEIEVGVPDQLRNSESQLIVTARLADPLADPLGEGYKDAVIKSDEEAFMAVKENKGIIITGKIFSKTTGLPKAGSTVLFSVSDTLPHFDYCIADEAGRFYFYLRNVVGTGNLVFQELTDNPEDTGIELDQNYITTPAITNEEQFLTNEQLTFTADVIKASYIDKFFNRSQGIALDTFSLHKDFQYPFYGPPTKTFYPELFIDLDDFTEISREILHGVQYRTKKDEVSIRLIDYGREAMFADEPFKLLDGVPVFDPSVFSDMGTTAIKKVDAVFYKRYFGDLNFSGVLAIYTNNPTLSWVESMPGMNLIRYACIQPARKWNFSSKNSPYSHIPDFQKVVLRQRIENIEETNQFSFDLPDISGDLIIEVIAVSKDNEIVQSRKRIKISE